MSVASSLERQMLELINAERASRGLQPVQLELRLNDAAEDHSQWMLDVDKFSHTGVGKSQPWDRMEDAGFVFSGSWRATENIAWQSVRGAPGLADDVQNLHDSLMNSPGHKANILDPNVTVIGIGIETGKYLHNGVNYDAIMVTQNFARTSAAVQLDTGGSGGGGTPLPSPAPAPIPAGPVEIFVKPGKTGNAEDNWFTLEVGKAGRLDGRGGDDTLTGQSGRDTLLGRSGDDTLRGEGGRDRLFGGQGNDTLEGGDDRDILKGQAGDDTMSGGTGDDVLRGGSGTNIMTGGAGADDFFFSNGINRVTDFEDGDQVVLRSSAAIKSYKDLMNNHISQSGSDVVIDDGKGHMVILEDTLLADLDRDSFIF